MPRIPQQNSPTVAPRALPTPQLGFDTRGAFADGIAPGLQASADGMGRLAADLRQKEQKDREDSDRTAVLKALAEVESDDNDALYKGETAFFRQQGDNALANHDAVLDRLSKKRSEVLGRLTSERQKEMFSLRSDERLIDVRRQIENHTGNQIEAVKDAAFKVAESKALESLELGYGDMDAVGRRTNAYLQDVIDEANRRGFDAKTKTKIYEDASSRAAEAVLKGYLNQKKPDVEAATNFFEANKKTLGVRAAQYEGRIRELGKAGRIEKKGGSIITNSRPEGFTWVDPDSALAEVEAMSDEDADKADVRRYVEHQIVVSDSLKAKAAADQINKAIIILEKNGGNLTDKALAEVEDYFSKPQNGHADKLMELKNKYERERRIKLGGAGGAAARKKQSDIDREMRLLFAARASTDMADAASADLVADYPGVSDVGLAQLKADQAKFDKIIRGGGLTKWTTAHSMAKEEAERTGKFKAKKALNEFEGWFRDWYDSFQINEKREPTRDDVQKALGKALQRLSTDGLLGFFGTEKWQYQIKPGEEADYAAVLPQDQPSPLARRALEEAHREPEAPKQEPLPGSPGGTKLPPLKPVNAAEDDKRAKKAAAIAEIRRANPGWKPEQVTAALRKRGL